MIIELEIYIEWNLYPFCFLFLFLTRILEIKSRNWNRRA